MHSPLYQYETEAQDRINSYMQEAQSWNLAEQAQRKTYGSSRSWLASLQARVRATANQAANAIGAATAKPSEPAEQCC
jgi:hypothetical protein